MQEIVSSFIARDIFFLIIARGCSYHTAQLLFSLTINKLCVFRWIFGNMKSFYYLFILCLLFACNNGIKIECFYDNELLFDEMKLTYTCTVLKLITNETNRDISEVTPENGKSHLPDSTNDDVRQLYIIHQIMKYFPRGFTKFFENIEAIHAGMNKLKYLVRDDVKEFTKIKFLYLYSNHLENLQSDVFLDNLELEYISFNNNRLMHIGSKLLTPLRGLRTAYFNKNICIDKQAVHSEKEVAEIRLEISERCSDITDEDLMTVLKQNQERIMIVEEKVNELKDIIQQFTASFNKTEL